MPIRIVFGLLQFLLLATICFAGAYHLTRRPQSVAAPRTIMVAPGVEEHTLSMLPSN
ncbi:hypothetical protein SAMN06269173_106340 [Hymenobacter mucosus]|uniref:Uncharacterized protein n=1 Tax=Hymenobacter mucosus TaxID=1411120 RepID=A0A238Z5X4_9BACT|nr:hypothetical protein SAMN06269173_106340 [Hymenobacter mucosus]